MAPVSRLGRQVKEIILCLDRVGAATALICGLALAPYNVIRATSDIDLLADAGLADAIDRELRKLGYQCLYRSADVANYVRGDERVDFLFAIRPAAVALLATVVDAGHADRVRPVARPWRSTVDCVTGVGPVHLA